MSFCQSPFSFLCSECLKAKTKYEKLERLEKTGQNVVKTQQAKKAWEAAKEDFDSQNKLLLMELPQFYEKRVDYFQPCLQALVRSQVNYYGETVKLFTLSQTEDADQGALNDKDFFDDVDKHLTAMKSLSIVGK